MPFSILLLFFGYKLKEQLGCFLEGLFRKPDVSSST